MILANNYSAGFYYTLLREYPGIITFLQPDFTIQFQSTSFYTYTDHHPEETVRDNFLQIVHPLDVHPLINLLMAAKANVKAKPRLTLRIRKPDGDYLSVATTVTCVSTHNLVEGYILYSQRVEGDGPGDAFAALEAVPAKGTEKKPTTPPANEQTRPTNGLATLPAEEVNAHFRAEPDLNASSLELEVYKDVLDRSVLVAIADTEGKIIRVNDLFCHRTGYTREELTGMDFRALLHPDFHPEPFFAGAWEELTHGQPWRGDLCNLAKDGSSYWVEASIQSSLHHDAITRFIFFGYEITDRKRLEDTVRQSEKRLREAQALAHTGSWEYDFKSRQMTWSDEVFIIYGLDPAAGVPHLEDLVKYHHPEDWPDLIEASINLRERREVQNIDIRIVQPGDRVRYVNLIGKPLLGADGQLLKLYGTAMDIDARKVTEKNLQSHNEELLRLNRQLDRFVYSATHDLRSPLMSMKGLVNLAQVDDDPDQQVKYYQLMLRSIDKLDNIIRDIVDISRNRRTDVQSDRINFEALIREIQEGLNHLPGAEGIAVRVSVKEDGPFYSDAKRLGVLFNNLISNAYRYSDATKPDSFVEVDVEVSGREALIKVADNGIGIGQEHLHRIFEMFYRATETRDGTGLGLYLVKEIVDVLGGSIQIQSQLKAGTVFTITLPNRRIE
jgi:PAS domain S-box-containing protein